MKKIILLLHFAVSAFMLSAQEPDWQWARYATGTGTQETMYASTDPSGNAYLTGNFQASVTFGSTTATQPGLGLFLAKFDAAGNLKWLRTAGGIGSNAVFLVTTDKNANTYITGRFANQITFGAFTLTSTLTNIYHIFIAKYDSSGNVLWARSAGETGNGYDMTWAVNVDAASNVYISGNVQSDTISLDTDTLYSEGGSFCLIKYDSSGTELWSRNAYCPYFALSQHLTTDSQGNVYVTGFFSGDSVVFGSTTLYNSGPPAMHDIFFVSYDSSGNFRWAKAYGGNGTDDGYGLAVDGDDHIYLTGTFNSASVTFDSNTILNPTGQYNYFLAKYNSSGAMLWMQSDSGKSAGYSIAIDAFNNLYWSGRFYSPTVTIDTMTLQRPAVYYDPIFLVKLDSAGHIFWGKVLGSGGDDANGISLGNNGDIYFSGDFYGMSAFVVGNDTLYLSGTENAFIAKLGFTNIVAAFTSSGHTLCPGTCTDFINNSANALSYQWLFPGSNTPQSSDINPANICYNTPGQYDVTLIATGNTGTDTLTLVNYITVLPYPASQGIVQIGDTLFANPGAQSYRWYLNGNIINGATNYFHVALQSGNYNLIATDVNGCEVEAAIFNVIANINLSVTEQHQLSIFPNPVTDFIKINFPDSINWNHEIQIMNLYNQVGQRVLNLRLKNSARQLSDHQMSIDVRSLPSGVYRLEMKSDDIIFRSKFIKL